jgi:uncharacterized protein
MARVVHFEITADDPERAVKFYAEAFGWFVEKWQGPLEYWVASTGEEDEPGINGAIMRKMPEACGILPAIDVDDLEEALERVLSAGGEVVQPRRVIPYIGYQAYCRDTEGNVFGLMQADTAARAEA